MGPRLDSLILVGQVVAALLCVGAPLSIATPSARALGAPHPTAGEVAQAAAREAPRLVVRSDPELARLARNVGSAGGIWESFPGIPDSVLADEQVTVWFVRDLARLDSLGLGRQEPWVAGVANPARRIVALRVDGAQRNVGRLRAVYRHEAAHVALHAATGGNAPRWLHEGYAQAASGTWDWQQGWRLQFILMGRGHDLLTDLERRFRAGREPEAAYILSYTAVDALRSIGGEAGLSALFASLSSGSSMDEAFREVYGLTAEQFESRWRDRVLDRYGWLYLLSRTAFVWLSVTLMIIALGIARVRRDRRRLAEMRERERLQAAAFAAALRAVTGEGRGIDGPPEDVDGTSSPT